MEREDVEEYEGREIKPEDNGYKDENDPRANQNVFPGLKRKPLRAKKGKMSLSFIMPKKESLLLKWNLSQLEKI